VKGSGPLPPIWWIVALLELHPLKLIHSR